MKKAVIYIHGKGGNVGEAEHYKSLFPKRDVIGFDYKAQTPWEAALEFPEFFDAIKETHSSVSIIANSIGAFFSMHSLGEKEIESALLISPVVDMEKLIADMIIWANTSEEELADKKEIETSFGETLSWDYLCYVRAHPIHWSIPTRILYGAHDNLTSYETISDFAKKAGAMLTVMDDGEHWFHTEEQMAFLDNWVKDGV